jgi:hypothetical protein
VHGGWRQSGFEQAPQPDSTPSHTKLGAAGGGGTASLRSNARST